jgi:hypothetical protein
VIVPVKVRVDAGAIVVPTGLGVALAPTISSKQMTNRRFPIL